MNANLAQSRGDPVHFFNKQCTVLMLVNYMICHHHLVLFSLRETGPLYDKCSALTRKSPVKYHSPGFY